MTTKHQTPEHHLVVQCKDITNHFENQIADLIMPARHLSVKDKDKISSELKGTIQNINFMLTSLFCLNEKEGQ